MRLPFRKPGKYTVRKIDPLLTKDKIEILKKKLKRLKASHPKLAADVSRLAEMGDFSENAEYQHAKWQLRRTLNAIKVTEARLDHAVVIEKPKQKKKIELGHTVTLVSNKKEMLVTILGPSETNPAKGIISNQSPLGIALLGKKIGESVCIGKSDVEYKIVGIQ
jgi:transcription elongation factor GreA